MFERIVSARRWILAGVALALLIVIAPAAANAGSDESYKRSPGYVDFEPLLGGMESSVEIFLKGSLLVLAREAVRDEDPELGDLLSKIEYVRVQVFPVNSATVSQLKEKTRDVAKALDKKGWEMAVRVREEDEQVLVYLLPGANDVIQGIVVMAVEEDDEAAFINVVGDINPAEIGKIGRTLNIHSLDIPMKVEVDGDAEIIVEEGAHKHSTHE